MAANDRKKNVPPLYRTPWPKFHAHDAAELMAVEFMERRPGDVIDEARIAYDNAFADGWIAAMRAFGITAEQRRERRRKTLEMIGWEANNG